ncbi:MAG: YcjF family protein [Desulfobacterales bacterium]|nr:YcjF family protein [Desulfobacterales bacterium]
MEKETGKIKVTRKRKRLYEDITGDASEINKAVTEALEKGADIHEHRQDKAMHIISLYAKFASGTGLLPVPVLDMMVVNTVGVKMLRRLCSLYGLEFSEEEANTVIKSLTRGRKKLLWAGSLIKIIPLLGSAGGGLTVLVKAGRIIYGIGDIMVEHFESGGTLEDFDPSIIEH